MKLLLFSDLHCDAEAAQRLVEIAEDVDVLVGAGDFGSIRHNTDIAIEVLNRVEKPAVLVPGNNESLEELKQATLAWPSARVLHGSGVTIDGIEFFGLGGGIPVTPFGAWSWDFTEEQAAALLADCPAGCVLVTHSPPKGAVDVSSRGQSLGSAAVAEAVRRTKPALVVCGHIHESAGESTVLEGSPVVNAGPSGIVWDLTM